MIYHPAETPLMKMARQAGCRTENGFSMLLGQAAASFQIWTGREMPLRYGVICPFGQTVNSNISLADVQ